MTNLLIALMVLAGILMMVLALPDCSVQPARGDHQWLAACLR
jgi:hypothetical protein